MCLRSVLRPRSLKSASIPPSSTNRRLFINWLIAELHAADIAIPEHWNYTHLREAITRWRQQLTGG